MATKNEVMNLLNYYNDLARHTKQVSFIGTASGIDARTDDAFWNKHQIDYTKPLRTQAMAAIDWYTIMR